MKEITANQLALLLDIKREDAVKKVVVALERESGFEHYELKPATLSKYDKNPSISISLASRYLGVDLDSILQDIKKNYLKNPATGRWIYDYPASKLKVDPKTGRFPLTVSIPGTLKSLLTEEQIKEIISKWEIMYAEQVAQHGVKFK